MAQGARKLVVGDEVFLWRMRWSYDRDGERIVHVAAWREVGRRRPVHARFVSRQPEYPAPTAVALPGDVRAVIDRACADGWTGARPHWLLPACGLERPDLVLSAPTRLREWAGDALLYELHIDDPAHAAALAADLDVPADPQAAGAAEGQWRGPGCMILRSRWGRYLHVYTRTLAALVDALAAAHRRDPRTGVSVGSRPATVHGPGKGEVPAPDIVPPDRWASVPGASRYPGPRDGDVVWVTRDHGDLRVDFYFYHHDARDRLWLWTTLREGEPAIERRFNK